MLRASPRRRNSDSVRVVDGIAAAATTPMMPSVATSSMTEKPCWRLEVRTPQRWQGVFPVEKDGQEVAAVRLMRELPARGARPRRSGLAHIDHGFGWTGEP